MNSFAARDALPAPRMGGLLLLSFAFRRLRLHTDRQADRNHTQEEIE